MQVLCLIFVLIGLTRSLPVAEEEIIQNVNSAPVNTVKAVCENGAEPEVVDKAVVIIEDFDLKPNKVEIEADAIVLCDAR